MQQEQRGSVDRTYVPEPRGADHDDVAVGTAQAPAGQPGSGERGDERYPSGTYASGFSGADTEHERFITDGDADGRDDTEERDEVETARAEEAEDQRWETEHPDGDAADRTWAAEHATQLRAGAIDTPADDTPADDTTADDTTADDRDGTRVDAADRDETLAVSDPADTAAEPAAEPVGEPVSGEPGELLPGAVEVTPVGALWADGAVDGLRERWRELQLRFIDDPRSVAGEADALVAEAVGSVTAALESQRRRLAEWQQQDGDDTERLRAAVRQYRDFLDRLLGL
ncbi:hypothetical protein GCM10010399_72530 [Dactylosporangium fulvum]|uniref:Uncharacterized protein n=1 Tax=Dactylosporangium fulvum TaxID=53359 RepID=A0ABY5VYH2_9ACTN|nr:hypothetical protein [Dactylosporangium fulvum]UWP80801.1 hypothetical protein Dfulv_37535 [Dactylosporangium fulvum]